MKRRSITAAAFLFLAAAGFYSVYHFRDSLIRQAIENLLNHQAKPFFAHTLRVGEARLRPDLGIELTGLRGGLQTESGALSLEMSSVVTKESLIHYFSPDGVTLNFYGLRPSEASEGAVSGEARMRGGRNWSFDLAARINNLGLEHLVLLNPPIMEGARGSVRGEMMISTGARMEPKATFDFHIEKPGGRMQSQFFKGFIPYLPASVNRRHLIKLYRSQELVHFREADFRLDVFESDRIKVFLHIYIPDYNLNLNLNVDIRTDEKDAMMRLASILGILKVEFPS